LITSGVDELTSDESKSTRSFNMSYIRLLWVFILPPVAVAKQFGFGKIFYINCLLTLLGFVPGLLHAVYMMASRPPGLVKLN